MNCFNRISGFQILNLEEVETLMHEIHAQDRDEGKYGYPYAYHCLRARDNVELLWQHVPQHLIDAYCRDFPEDLDPETTAKETALLHDSVENHPKKYNIDKLAIAGVALPTLHGVCALTRPINDNRKYDQLVEDVIATGHLPAIVAKMGDNMDNVHPDRNLLLKASNPKKFVRIKPKYYHAIRRFAEHLEIDMAIVRDLIHEQATPLPPASERLLAPGKTHSKDFRDTRISPA